jgi:hypothetical protein
MTSPFKDTTGTLCNGGEWSPHRKWRGIKLPIKVITPPKNVGTLPKPATYDGYQLFVLPGGDAVYFPNGETPVYPKIHDVRDRLMSRTGMQHKMDELLDQDEKNEFK